MAKKNIPLLPEYRIQNIVSTVVLENPIDLAKIAEKFPSRCNYQPWRFPGAILKLPIGKERVTFLIFRQGKIVCTGLKSFDKIKEVYETLFNKLKEIYPDLKIKKDISISNIVASGKFEKPIDLYKLAEYEDNVIYEPEIFPGATITFGDIKAMITRHGIVNFVGAKNEEQIKEIAKKVYEIGKKYLIG
jgi:transcription initiation factor TFIID TATA-box-binding protein